MTYFYRSPRALGIAAISFVFLHVVASLALDATLLSVGATPPEDDLGAALLMLATGLAQLFTILLAAVTVLAWVHRVATNVRALGQEGLQHSPGWAVGVWLIPFANLVRPYLAMKEIYQASDPETVGGRVTWRGGRGAPIMPLWWGAWIVAGLLGNVSARLQERHLGPAVALAFGSTACAFVAALALASLVAQLTRRQEAAWARFAALGWGGPAAWGAPQGSWGAPQGFVAAPPIWPASHASPGSVGAYVASLPHSSPSARVTVESAPTTTGPSFV